MSPSRARTSSRYRYACTGVSIGRSSALLSVSINVHLKEKKRNKQWFYQGSELFWADTSLCRFPLMRMRPSAVLSCPMLSCMVLQGALLRDAMIGSCVVLFCSRSPLVPGSPQGGDAPSDGV